MRPDRLVENGCFEHARDPGSPQDAAEPHESGGIVVDPPGRRERRGEAFEPGSFYSYDLAPGGGRTRAAERAGGPQAGVGG